MAQSDAHLNSHKTACNVGFVPYGKREVLWPTKGTETAELMETTGV